MQQITQKISSADRNPAYPITSINGFQSKTSLLGGILGITFWIILLLLIIQKSITVFGKTEVLVQSFVERNQQKIVLYPNQSVFQVGIYCANQDKWIDYNQQKQYGFEVFVFHWNFWFDEEEFAIHNITTVRRMVPCKQFNDSFCIPPQLSNLTIECDIEKLGPDGCLQVQLLSFRIIECDNLDPECNSLDPSLFVITGFKNNKFNVFEPKTDQIITMADQSIQLSEITLDRQHQYVFRLMLSKLEIKTDESIMPSLVPGHENSVIDTWFYPNQKYLYESFFPNVRRLLLSIEFRRSEYTERYRRSFVKIDTMLGEVLGFMGLITWIVSICCSGYNQYLMREQIYRKKVQQLPIEAEEGEQFVAAKPVPNFLTYCKQILNNLKGICKRNKQYYGPKKQIDLMQLYIKVNNHEELLKTLKSEKSLPRPVSMPSPQTRRESKNERASLEKSLQKQQEIEIKKSLMSEELSNG